MDTSMFESIGEGVGSIAAVGIIGALLVFIISLVVFGVVIVWYILSSIGIKKVADGFKIKNSWLAWLPVGREYVLGSLYFEKSGAKSPWEWLSFSWMKWIWLGEAAASIVINQLSTVASILNIVLLIWGSIVFFKEVKPQKVVGCTIGNVLLSNCLLFFMRNSIKNEKSKDKVVEATIVEK